MADTISKKLSENWKYYFAVLIIALLYAMATKIVCDEFLQLPSPLFGGDMYYQLGAVYHVAYGDWFGGTNIHEHMPVYLPLYPIAVTFYSMGQLEPMEAMLQSAPLWSLISVLLFAFLLKKIVKDPAISVLGIFFIIRLFAFPILKYTEFASMVIVPLFFIVFYNFFKDNRANMIYLGVVFGLMSIAHGTTFLYGGFMLGLLFIYQLIWKRTFNLLPFVIVGLIGTMIAMTIWFDPIFVKHGKGLLLNNIFPFPDFAKLGVQLDMLWAGLSMSRSIAGILAFLGIYHIFKSRKVLEGEEYSYLRFLLIATFIFIYSYFVTSPLLDFHTFPNYGLKMFIFPVLMLIGIVFARDWIKRNENADWLTIHKRLHPRFRHIALVCLSLCIIGGIAVSLPSWYEGTWKENARAMGFDDMTNKIQAHLLENTNINDVILSNNELSFMLNGISGRKVVASRRSHNSPFLNYDQRQVDAAIMLYGKDEAKRVELLKKYNVSYLYFDVRWIQVEFDPIMVLDNPEYSQKLTENGVNYSHQYSQLLDPAQRGWEYRRYDVFVVTPDNYVLSGKGIWNNDIDKYLKTVWYYESESDGEISAMLSKVEFD